MRQRAYRLDVRPTQPVLDGPPHRRAKFEGMHQNVGADELRARELLQPVLHPGALVDALGDDHHLAEVRIGELLVERQVEADRALADI